MPVFKSADNTDAAKVSRQWRKQRTEAGQLVAECEGLAPKHDAVPQPDIIEHFGNADAVAAPPRAVLKPQGRNCAVLPYYADLCDTH